MRRSLRRVAAVPFAGLCAVLVGVVVGPLPAAQAADSCGSQIAKPGGGYYQCTFADNFNGSKLDTSKWIVQTTAASGFHSGAECFVNKSANVLVAGGFLNLTVRKLSQAFLCTSPSGSYTTQYTSGTVNTFGKFDQAYGRFEISARFPSAIVAGLQESLWMAPTYPTYGAWPRSGEIDIAEQYSLYPTFAVPYVHYVPVDYDLNSTKACWIGNPAKFHQYLLEWTPSSIKISFDGNTCIDDAWNPASPLVKPQPFDQPFVIALTQALGVGANSPTLLTPLPATTSIDYVRVWS
jgi:beta-glucanase (GH16 family)